ncbi:MAG: hypothetical protein ACR2HJ_05395 [Fimbriimonadales bacterium]
MRTDPEGKWALEHGNDTAFFVIKPRGWMTPTDYHKLPKFYYIHKPNGSPQVKYGGVKPTGPLPKSIDFPLQPQREPDRFKALFFGDTQPRDKRDVDRRTLWSGRCEVDRRQRDRQGQICRRAGAEADGVD